MGTHFSFCECKACVCEGCDERMSACSCEHPYDTYEYWYYQGGLIGTREGLTLLGAEARKHPAWPAFVRAMDGQACGLEATYLAWVRFKETWDIEIRKGEGHEM